MSAPQTFSRPLARQSIYPTYPTTPPQKTTQQTVIPADKKGSATIPSKTTPIQKKLEVKTPPAKTSKWEDFPVYPDSQTGCLELDFCMRTKDNLAQVTRFFEQELAKNKYVFYEVASTENSKVYRITRNDRTEFLSLFTLENSEKTETAYTLSEQFLDIDQLIAGENTDQNPLLNSDGSVAEFNCKQFAQPELFCEGNTKRAEIDSIEFAEGLDLSFIVATIRVNEQAGYTITKGQPYGDGDVYILSKDGQSTYINVLRDKSDTGTITVTWNQLPQPK
ncbi:MAG: hypothetical protein WBB82_11665 [Limnothrix sp.]